MERNGTERNTTQRNATQRNGMESNATEWNEVEWSGMEWNGIYSNAITTTTKTLIDHIISNIPSRVTYTSVLHCPVISDHDAPYACVNVRVIRFQPRYKMIRDEKQFDEKVFIEGITMLPLNLVYSTDDADDKLESDIMFKSCLDKHAPLRRMKITRPPAPWLNADDIRQLQTERNKLRHLAHATNLDNVRQAFREVRNKIKSKIKQVKRSFYQKALSSSKPKELWRTIHRILHPSRQPISADPNVLNNHFSTTSQRLLGTSPTSSEDLQSFINSLPDSATDSFCLRPVTYQEVIKQLKSLHTMASNPRQNSYLLFLIVLHVFDIVLFIEHSTLRISNSTFNVVCSTLQCQHFAHGMRLILFFLLNI